MSGALLATLAVISLWNATGYPAIGGFDASEHISYARLLVEHHELPKEGAFYTPPGFYLIAGSVFQLGEALPLDDPATAVQILNALLGVGTGLLVLSLAALLFPRRPVVRWAALAFFVSCPVVLKTLAMFHPQPLALFLSTLALWITARMIVHGRYTATAWIALALTLAAGQLVRSVMIMTVGVVLLTLLVAAAARPDDRRRIGKALAICSALVVLLPLPWYIHLKLTTSSAVFGRETVSTAYADRWPAAFYLSPGLPQVITEPQREALAPRFFPLLYADSWGDYFGIWSWNPPRPELTPPVNRRLALQSVVGLPLTVLAGAGWLAIAALAVRRWRDSPARLLVALMPPVALAGVLYYATRGPSADGDTIKAMFLLPAVPAWAISFGFAADVLLDRSRRVAVPVLVLLGLCGLVSLVYATFASVS